MHNLIQFLEARTPLQRNVSVKKLLILFDVTCSINFESVFVEESDHTSVGSARLAGIVEWGTAGSHTPGLIDV